MPLLPDEPTERYDRFALVASVLLLLAGLATADKALGVVHVVGSGANTEWIYSYSRPPLTLLAMLCSAAAPMLARRWLLWAWALAAVVPLVALTVDRLWPFTSYAGLVAVALIGQWSHPRLSWLVPVPGLAFPLSFLWGLSATAPDGNVLYLDYRSPAAIWVTIGLYVIYSVVVLLGGQAVRVLTRRTKDEAVLEADRGELIREGEVLTERSRLARDLHDVVAHHVSLIAVRAETAPYTVPDLQPQARVVLADVADHARQALDELRGVLGVLRRGEESDLVPQPTGADVVDLVAKARAVGPVDLAGADVLADLDATRGYVAYRVVQEALTNARRHAPGEAVTVDATTGEDGLLLRVSNRADGVAAVVPGRGLTGMRERVEALGGTMVGEVRGGAVVVEVRLS